MTAWGLRASGRLRAAVLLEGRLLFRHGVVAAAAVTTTGWVAVVLAVPEGLRATALEVIVFCQLAVVGYTFAGALVLLDKSQGTALALAVTPLRVSEHLAARVTGLTALAGAASAAVTFAGGPPAAPPPAFALGVLAASVIALLVSLAVAAPHESVSRWLLPSVPPLLLLAAPLVGYAGVETAALWLLPTQGALVLLRGPSSLAAWLASLGSVAAWTAVLWVVCRRRLAQWAAMLDG